MVQSVVIFTTVIFDNETIVFKLEIEKSPSGRLGEKWDIDWHKTQFADTVSFLISTAPTTI